MESILKVQGVRQWARLQGNGTLVGGLGRDPVGWGGVSSPSREGTVFLSPTQAAGIGCSTIPQPWGPGTSDPAKRSRVFTGVRVRWL